MRRALFASIVGATLFLLGPSALDAQNPPRPPHQYYGDGTAESAAQIDGVAPPEGTVIIALDATGDEVGRTTITQTHWLIQVSEENTSTVSFEFLGCGDRTEAFPVQSGELTAVRIDAAGCEPTIDQAALAAAADATAANSSGSDVGTEEATATAAEAGPSNASSTSPTPVPADDGVDTWIWIVVVALVLGVLGAGIFWARRPRPA
jgi:hypothetical protein